MKNNASKMFISMILLVSLSCFASSAAAVPSVFKSKYPKETVIASKSADLDKDRKNETVIITKKGSLYLVDGANVRLVRSNMIIEDQNPDITIFVPVSGSLHVMTREFYLPGNTVAKVYRMKNGTLVKLLDIVADAGVSVKSGKVCQTWKRYSTDPDIGGWTPATAIYSWSVSKLKYVGSGNLP